MSNFVPLKYIIHPYSKKLKQNYDIKNSTTYETHYRIYYTGFFTFTLHMADSWENDVFTAKKVKFWKNEYTIFKQGEIYAILKIKSKMFDSKIELQIENRTYFSSKINMMDFEFTDNNGNLAFIVKKNKKSSEKDGFIEIYNTIEPELAIFASILILYTSFQPSPDIL
ncbi:MAG: hypothetical protein ACTSSG_08650 [Candidatus Heimdallarchaeaceae archaeon]